VKQRTSWAEANRFAAMNRLRASQHLSAALPGLTSPGQLVEVLTAFEKDGFVVADVTVPAEHRVDLRISGASWQAMAVVRVFVEQAVPLMEVRPWSTWPPDHRDVSHRGVTIGASEVDASGRFATLLTEDAAFDAAFVARAKDRAAASALLTPQLRAAMLECPSATYLFAPGMVIAMESGLLANEELDRIVHALDELRTALVLPPYIVRSTVYTRVGAVSA
jgi:hypothetical protein